MRRLQYLWAGGLCLVTLIAASPTPAAANHLQARPHRVALAQGENERESDENESDENEPDENERDENERDEDRRRTPTTPRRESHRLAPPVTARPTPPIVETSDDTVSDAGVRRQTATISDSSSNALPVALGGGALALGAIAIAATAAARRRHRGV